MQYFYRMLPILITLVVTAPILALGTWLYLRRRELSPRIRIVFMLIFFLFFLLSGPVVFVVWHYDGISEEILSSGRSGRKFSGQFFILWLMGTLTTGTQLFRLCRKKGEL